MFFLVKVKKEEDLTQEPQEYCMTVHLFGAGSSPGNAQPKTVKKSLVQELPKY